MTSLEELKSKIGSFKKRYHTRQLILGILGFIILNSAVFLAVVGLEYRLWFGVSVRAVLFFVLVVLVLGSGYFLIVKPLMILTKLKQGLSDEEAAKTISIHFSEIQDRLLNTLQLGNQDQKNELLIAAINKKSSEFKKLSFIQAVDFKPVRHYLLITFGVIVVFGLVSFISPSILVDSPGRIVNFSKVYEKNAPFEFILENKKLNSFRGEDLDLNVRLEGELLPEKVKIIANSKIIASIPLKESTFNYLFSNLQENKEIEFEAAGFKSPTYKIEVNDRPDLVSMLIQVVEPGYTGGQRRTIENTGNLVIPEGSSVLWEINALATDSTQFYLADEIQNIKRIELDKFSTENRIFNSADYRIELYNQFGQNKSKLNYAIDVIEDQYPEIFTEFFPDSITYQSLILAGSISDDYGLSALKINYKKSKYKGIRSIPLEINKQARSQSYFANWNLDSLNLQAGESLEVYLSVYDNDGVNGSKETRSAKYILKAPSSIEISSMISEKQNDVEKNLDDSREKAEQIADRLEKIEERLKSEQKFDWQEKKLLNEVIEDREELEKQIDQLKKEHEGLNQSTNRFQKQSENIQQKNDQLQELLEQLMDEETQELYEKLKELMEQNPSSDQITQELNDLKKNERNLERDLERALELFKRLKMENALEQNLQKLDTLSQEQEAASQQPNNDELQKDVNEQFNEFREKMDEVEKLNQELKRPEALEDFDLEERQIAKELQEILEEMEREGKEEEGSEKQKDSDQKSSEQDGSQNEEQESQENIENDQNKSSNSQKQKSSTQQKQKNAAQKMKSLSQKLSNMQGGMQMEMMQANLDQLRDILDNLVKLSFSQEEIMLEMREVSQSDPRFLELSQNQLKLKDDAKVIQDSLLSLASKVVQISSFITREVGSINENINQAIEYLKNRNRGRALSSQQFAMTSINNLALLLDDTMQQMQMAMAESMGNSSSGEKQKPQGMPDLQEMQNQLGKKINDLEGSGKSGRELSEELARLAAEQEMIRRQMELLKESQDGKPGGGLGGDELKKAVEMMEQNEVDLVNKRLTRQLINRQKQIMTRMLEAEKAQRNQETEEEREAQQPRIISREIPPGFEKYLELKKKEIELLKTIPLELNQFYKKEVNDYFRRLSSEDQND